ncbi:MAG: hypothetical protein IJ363_02980 [Clostridia bacterium]|nr:hypothetical protein [Clostridia bacterium]
MNKRFLILLTLALAALLLMSGCDAAPANKTTADTDPPYIMDGQTIFSDKIPFTMSLVQTTLTEADTFITVAIKGKEPGYFGMGDKWCLYRLEADGTATVVGECAWEIALEMSPAEGKDTVDTTKKVTLNQLQCEALTEGEYVLQYMIDSPAGPAASMKFTVVKAGS